MINFGKFEDQIKWIGPSGRCLRNWMNLFNFYVSVNCSIQKFFVLCHISKLWSLIHGSKSLKCFMWFDHWLFGGKTILKFIVIHLWLNSWLVIFHSLKLLWIDKSWFLIIEMQIFNSKMQKIIRKNYLAHSIINRFQIYIAVLILPAIFI